MYSCIRYFMPWYAGKWGKNLVIKMKNLQLFNVQNEMNNKMRYMFTINNIFIVIFIEFFARILCC